MGFQQISSYLPEQVPANKFLFAGTVPANNLFLILFFVKWQISLPPFTPNPKNWNELHYFIPRSDKLTLIQGSIYWAWRSRQPITWLQFISQRLCVGLVVCGGGVGFQVTTVFNLNPSCIELDWVMLSWVLFEFWQQQRSYLTMVTCWPDVYCSLNVCSDTVCIC